MKINSYKLKKKNVYELLLEDNSKIELYEDTILEYNLLLTKEIKDIKEIYNYNNNIECYYKAVSYINSKLRTEKEIKDKLKDYDAYAVEYAIKRLNKEGLLSKELYISSYINDSINIGFKGQKKIVYELKNKGFNESDINKYLDTIDNSIFIDKINKYILNKVKCNKKYSSIYLKNKIKDDLLSKGFLLNDINNCLNNIDIKDDKDIYLKEYNKLKTKLSKKYEGDTLEYQINIHLRSKGFSKSE